MSEYASRGRSLESSHAPRSSSVNEAHAPRTRTAAEQAHDVVTAFEREVKAIGGAIEALGTARDANDPQRWQELRTAADRQIAVADHSLQRATTHAGHAAPEVKEQLVVAERVLAEHKANAQAMREPPLGFRPVAAEGAILDVLSAPVEGSAQVGYAHKESALKAQFDQLSVADSRALIERLRTGRPNDPVASAFGRMTTERRGRLLAFLDDARRREAVRIARGPKVPGANPSSRPETTARPAAVTTIDPEIAVRGVDGATETAALDRNAGPQKLPDSVRSDLEAATGTSLDHVRVHADAHGHAVAASHGARAVAIGSDIYMGKGELDVNSPRGRELLAHEVAHVVQAKANPGHAAMKRDGESSIDAAEHDADTFATAFQRHGRAALWTPKVGVSGSTAMRKPLGESVRSRDAFNAKLDNQLSIAERTGVSVSAPAFMHLHMPEIRRAAHLFLAARTISSGDPQVELRDGFFDALFEAFDGNDTAASVTRLRNWVAPADLYAIVDRNRAIFDGRDKPQAGHPNAALDYEHGPKGPPHWAPAVGVAIGSAIEPHLIQSLARMSPRLVAVTARKREAAKASGGEPASAQPSELVSAHPLDWHVALAMVGRPTPGVEVKAGLLTVAADGRVAYRKIKQIEWQGAHGGAWNSLRVVDPPDANLEEVATHLLGKSTEGYRIQRVGSFYLVPVEDAARLPEAVRHRNTAPAGVAPLAFGKLAGNVETAEIERAMARDANRPQSATPTAAALEVQWQQIQEQLLGIAIVIRSSGLDIAMTSALARHGMHKVDLAGLSGRVALVRGELFTRQHTLLVKIAAEIGSVASRGAKKGASTKSASENVVEQLVHAASLSHLAETGEAAFATAHARQRDTIVDTLEAMLGQVATQIEIARQTADHSRARSKGSARAFGTTLQDRADALRQRVAELRSKLLQGVVDPAEVEALRAAIDALRFETGTVAHVGQLGQLFDVLDKLESSNWVVFSEGLTAAIGETTSDNRIGRLETARRGSHELRSALQTIHSQWLKVQGAAVAFSDRLAVGGSKDAHEQASSTMTPALNAIRARLTMLGGEAAIQAFLREAYDMVDSAETRAMIVQIASMIGIAVVSGGVAAMAEGVALGVGASVIGAQLAGLTVETVTFTLLSARLSGEPMLQAFASNFSGNLVTFGAMRATNAVVAGSAIGRTLAKAKAGERVAKLAAIAAKTAEITAPMLVAIGVQFAQAEAESLLREGRTLSMEELQIAGVQGIAMAIGAIVSHKVLGESMNDAKAFGAGHAARRAQRKHIEKLAADVMQQGDPSQALDLMREARAYVEAEIAKWQELGKLPENELESRGLSPKVVQTMGKAAKAHLAALVGAEAGTMPAQIGLDTVVPGHVYAGDPHDVQQVLESYRARGYRVDAEPGGYRVTRKDGSEPVHLIERQGPTSTRPHAPARRSRAEQRQAVVREIAEIPVSRVPAGTQVTDGTDGAQLHRDTYYVTHADGTRMQELLTELGPDVQVRSYKKGFIVRQGGEEWYFEFKDNAGKQGAARLRARPVDPKSSSQVGLPAANAATVELWGFRGVRTIHGRKPDQWTPAEAAEVKAMTAREPLLWAGHVGISTDGGKTIHGFTPVKQPDTTVETMISDLMNHEAYPGVVKNDTDVFVLAEKMAKEKGWNTVPVSAVELVDKPQKAAVVADIQRMEKAPASEHGEGYSFPLEKPEAGEHFRDSNGYCAGNVRNCASFPEKVGVSIPEPSGNLRRYIPELEKWATDDGPMDFRGTTASKDKKQ